MDPVYAHLTLNHVPVIGTLIALVLLAGAFLRRSDELARAALWLLVVMSLFGVVAFLTGEPAEERVEHLPGFSENAIHEHEEAAEPTLIAIIVMGVAALGALVAFWKKPQLPRWVVVAVLVAALVCAGLLGWTARLGGQIRHTEVGAAPAPDRD